MKNKSVDEILCDLISINSVNTKRGGKKNAEAGIIEYILDFLGDTGIPTELQPVNGFSSNLIVRDEVEKSNPWLLFCHHMDTVNVANMAIQPFSPKIEGQNIHGRGACDTKGSLAAVLAAFRKHASKGKRTGGNIALLFTTDEEAEKEGAKKFCEEKIQDFSPLGGVIVGEPTGMWIMPVHGGCIRFKIKTSGVAAHSSCPHLGESAISNMLEVVKILESKYIPALAAKSDSLIGTPVCSINMIEGGSEINIIPDKCKISIDRRLIPGEKPERVYDEIREFIMPLERKYKCRTEYPFVIDYPLNTPLNSPFIASLQSVYRQVGMPEKLIGAVYGTEASNFSELKIPVAVIGPGSIDQAHQADEWISLEQLHKGELIYFSIMENH